MNIDFKFLSFHNPGLKYFGNKCHAPCVISHCAKSNNNIALLFGKWNERYVLFTILLYMLINTGEKEGTSQEKRENDDARLSSKILIFRKNKEKRKKLSKEGIYSFSFTQSHAHTYTCSHKFFDSCLEWYSYVFVSFEWISICNHIFILPWFMSRYFL